MRAPAPSFRLRAACAATLLALALAAPALAAAPLDRTVQPQPGPAPEFRVPNWTRTRLANGADLVVVPKHDLPLVAVTLTFVGGSHAYEPTGKQGLAGFTAAMLSEGTTTRTAEQLSEAQQMLGTSIAASIGGESGSLGFTALADKLEPALALAADMLLHPVFPAPALERLRGRSLVALQQAKDNPNSIAANVFARTVFGDVHPYGRVTTEASVKSVTRDDVVAFHAAYFKPGRAVITVAGDVQPAAVKAAIEKAFAGWAAGGERPAWNYPPVSAPARTTIELVDKPGAAQSVLAIGLPGPPRSTPDYSALQLKNTLMGGMFQSRLNHQIREVKGWSYGVRSSFDYGHGPGAFKAGGGIITANTDSALVEFFRQFRGVRGDVPFTADELEQGKAALVQSLPERFGTVGGVTTAVAALSTQNLPETYYQEYPAKVRALTGADLTRVAKQYLDVDRMHVVVVGDRAVIEKPLAATGLGPIVILDADGKPVDGAK